jgi:hypothetical protein
MRNGDRSRPCGGALTVGGVARNLVPHRLTVIDAGLLDVVDRIIDVPYARLVVRVLGIAGKALDDEVVAGAAQGGERTFRTPS